MSRGLALPTGGRRSGNETVWDCPACGGVQKFWFNTRNHKGICYRCNTRVGNHKSLLRLFRNPPTVTVDIGDYPKKIGYIADSAHSERTADVEAYLRSRGVNTQLANQIPIRQQGKRILFPVSCPMGRPDEWIWRRLDHGSWMGPKYPKGLYWFGQCATKHPVLVEGVFDLLTPGLWGHGWALLGTNLSAHLECWLAGQDFETITIWFDNDPPGRRRAQQLKKRLNAWIDTRTVFGKPDTDPGNYSPEEAKKVLGW